MQAYIYIYIYIYIYTHTHTHTHIEVLVTKVIIGSELGYPSLKPEQGCLHFT